MICDIITLLDIFTRTTCCEENRSRGGELFLKQLKVPNYANLYFNQIIHTIIRIISSLFL